MTAGSFAISTDNLAIAAFLDSPTSTYLSPQKVARRLSMPVEDLAESAHVHRNSLRLRPQGPKIQSYLRQIVRVLEAAETIFGSRDAAILWMMNEPLARSNTELPTPLSILNYCKQIATYAHYLKPLGGLLFFRIFLSGR
jgi:hypothetical protein